MSFIAQNASGRTRVIKKIFVTRTQFDPTTGAFSTQTPEGTISVRFLSLFGPQADCCAEPRRRPAEINILQLADRLLRERSSGRDTYQFCLPFLLKDIEVAVTMSLPFAGQYSDLPFQDPWWKDLLAVLAFIFLVVCAVIAAVYGKNLSGGVATTASGDSIPVMQGNCCKTDQSVAGLIASLAAAIGSAVGAAKDVRDPFRRGQDQTMPAPGELTTSEHLKMSISYPEPVALGKPFAVGADWEYTRVTTGSSYSYAVSEINHNSHVLSNYQITAPNVIRSYRREPFIVKGEFFGADGEAFRGDQLFVQCILEGLDTLQGQYRRLIMQDDGNFPDDKPNDGVYTGIHYFTGPSAT